MKKTLTQYVYMKPNMEVEEGYEIIVVGCKYSYKICDTCILIKEVTVSFDFEIPAQDKLLELAVNTLLDRQEEVMAEAMKRNVELQGKINQLLTLTHKED